MKCTIVLRAAALLTAAWAWLGTPTAGAAAETTAACDCCGDEYGCDCGRQPFWFAGTEFSFMSVEAESGGRATMRFDDSDTAGIDLDFVGSDSLDDDAHAGRLWVGRQFGERWGVVGRFWSLSDSDVEPPTPTATSANLPNFLTTTDTSSTELYTIDVEGVRSFDFGRWKLDGSVGGRFASFTTAAQLSTFGVFTTGNFAQLSLSNLSEFDGAGITGGLAARRQLGDLPLYLFLSGRASSLAGETTSRARVSGTIARPPSAPLLGAATVTRADAEGDLTIGEVQAGIQWEFELAHWPANGFVRVAYEYQHWVIQGLPTGGAGFGGTISDVTVNSFVTANHGDAILHGLSIATGVSW